MGIFIIKIKELYIKRNVSYSLVNLNKLIITGEDT